MYINTNPKLKLNRSWCLVKFIYEKEQHTITLLFNNNTKNKYNNPPILVPYTYMIL